MIRPFELLIGLRYSRAKRRNGFISLISLISMFGIAIGVMALIVVISVMNGFQKEMRERLLGTTSHIIVNEIGGDLQNWQAVEENVINHPEITATAPFVEREVMLSVSTNVAGVIIRGVNPALESKVTEIEDKMINGSIKTLSPRGYGIIIGVDLAQLLGLGVGDSVVMITPSVSMTPVGAILRERRFTVTGVFDFDLYQFDRGTAFIHIADAQRLFRMGESVTGLRVEVDELLDAPKIAAELTADLSSIHWAQDWTQRNAHYFQAVAIERMAMFVILTLIVMVAAFNIVSTLVMVVTEKQSDIAILKTLGASRTSILLIFIVLGVIIGFTGTIMGVISGVFIAQNIADIVPWLEHMLGVSVLPKSVYFITEVPSDMRWKDVNLIATISFVISFLATIFPARQAAKTHPAQALRYE